MSQHSSQAKGAAASVRTAEFVSPKHPDKICDALADTILDNYLAQDPHARVAVEVMGGHGLITLNGEVTSTANIDCAKIVTSIVGEDYKVIVNLSKQSPEISRGVDFGGAGDQGIMVGFATRESASLLPREYDLARSLCQKIYDEFPCDGKVQVTLSGEEVLVVLASFQNSSNTELLKILQSNVKAQKYLVNPAGEWSLGGFDADSGLSGRKLVVDNYGPQVPIGGGSFSGKDYTKVDRSGAYAARKLAVDLLEKRGAKEVLVKLAYAIGIADPVMAIAVVDGRIEDISRLYDLRPRALRESLDLTNVKFADTCQWGHFGRNFPWDKGF